MYHFRSPNRSVFSKKARIAAALLLSSAAFYGTVMPASAALSQTPQARQEISQTRLSSMRGAEVSRIDWRQPEMKLKFDLSESDWIDGIDLILSMTPQGNVSSSGPVLVSLNNSAPLKMHPYGRSFDARLRFDESFVRAKGNVITIRVPAPEGAPCLTSDHGSWDVNVKKGSIVVRTRAKSRNYFLREVVDRLQNPTTTPKTVSILASGSQKTRLEMLAAQGIALQTPTIPNFKTTAGRSDMEVVIARRDQLAPRVYDKSILSETGPKISVHKGRPMRLVITGDTDAELSNAAEAFASYALPAVRRREASSGEVSFQTPFADRHTVLEGKTRFGDLDQAINAMDWRGTPNILTFNVADPSVKSGNIMLRLAKGKKIAKDSKVEVELNGQSLGFTTLDRRRKSVNFAIPEGSLHGVGNTLKITPELEKNLTVETFGQLCPSMDEQPSLFIGDGSRIELYANSETPYSELSRLTADGSLFGADAGGNTHIVLTSKSKSDNGASLELLAKLAKTSGTGWINATVSRGHDDTDSKNLLIIGPNVARTGLLGDAPRGLSAALKGQSSTGEMVRNFGDYEKFASADAAKTLQMYAARTRAKSRIGSGGVAAVYPDSKRLIGVISSTPGRSFSSVTQDLLEDAQWDNLTGSVARWNSKTVLMAQSAIPTPHISGPKLAPSTLPSLDIAWLQNGFADAGIKLADFRDATGEKLVLMRDNLETRFAGTGPTESMRFKTVEAAPTAPVYVSQKIKDPATTSAVPELLKTVAAAPQSASNALKLVAPLRGFSHSDNLVKANSRAPQWLTDLVAKIKGTQSPTSLTNLGNRSFGMAGIFMGLAFLLMVLLWGLVKPAPKSFHPRGNYK